MRKVVFYFNIIKRSGSEIALLRYFKNNKFNDNNILVYSDKKETDMSMIEEYSEYVQVKCIDKDEKMKVSVAVNCSIYDVDEELFEHFDAEKYVFWAQVNPNNMEILEDKTKLEKYDVFLATSKYIKEALIAKNEYTKGKIFLANPIVDSQEIIEKSKEHNELMDKKDFNIITIARYTPSKGQQYNIEIANLLKQMGVKFKWYNFGFSHSSKLDFYREIQAKIKKYNLEDEYILKSNCKNPYKYLKDADLNVLFSKDEAWGLVITEAKVLGVPNIASNNSAIKEQIEDDVNGYLIDIPKNKEDILTIANKIKYIYENTEKMNNLKKNLEGYTQNTLEIVDNMNKCWE